MVSKALDTEFKALSKAGRAAYDSDCQAESPTGAGGYPASNAKLKAGHYRNM